MKRQLSAAFAVAAMTIAVAGPVFAAATAATTTAARAATTTAPASTAATTAKPKSKTHYYIALATDTKTCSIVTKKPDGKTATMVGKYWYATDAKAKSAMKHQADCKTS